MVEVHANPVQQRFWLYLDPPDDDARNALLKRLRAQGIDDVLRLQEGPHAGAVSLGLYASVEGRERRLRALRAAGFEPRVEVREGVTREHWRGFALPDQTTLMQLQNKIEWASLLQDTGFQDVRIEKIDCVEAAAQAALATPPRPARTP